MKGNVGMSLALALTVAAACKSKEAEPAAESAAEGTAAPSEASEADAPRTGGHIVLPSNEPRYLNPILETRFNRADILVFEGLVGLDAALEPVPRLAESWERSDDGATLTFALRRGVVWSDGEPFTSADVAFTLDRIRNTEAPSSWKAYFAAVDAVETPDEHTVVVRYARPYAPALVSFTVGILPAHRFPEGTLVGAAANHEPVGTGPFKLQRWEQGKRILLAANEQWWNGRPHLDSIELLFEVGDRLDALREDRLDFADIPNVGEWATEAQMPEFRDGHQVTTSVESIFRLIAWNTRKAPFDDPRVRLALTQALDRQRVIDDILLGQAQALSAPFFPNMFGADPSIAPHRFDLEAARAGLAAAGVGVRKRFPLTVVSLASQRQPANEEMFALFRRDLAGLGVDLRVDYLDAEEFAERLARGDFDAAFFGWLRDIPDPDPSALLHAAQAEGGQNFAGYRNAEVDRLLEEAVATSDRDQRKALYQQLHAILHAELPYTVLYAPFSHYAWDRRLHAVNPADIGPQTRFPGASRWWVSR